MVPRNLQADDASDQARDIPDIVIATDVNDYYVPMGHRPFIRRQGFFFEVKEGPIINQAKLFLECSLQQADSPYAGFGHEKPGVARLHDQGRILGGAWHLRLARA
jgi:hypothetical protein